MRFAQFFGFHRDAVITNLRSNQNKCNIITSGFGIYRYLFIDGIRRYTLVYAGIRWYTLVYAWYTRGIRVVYARLFWYTRGTRAVYARYTRGICGLYAWYTRGIRWYTLMTPPAPKWWEPPAVIHSIGSERYSQITWDMAQDRCSEVMN